jgi:hypothetical protein
MRALIVALPLLAFLPACNLAPYTKADVAAVDMNGATASLEALRASAREVLAGYDALLAPDADLRAGYKAFAASADGFDGKVEGVKRAIDSVEKSTAVYLETYAATRESIKNQDLRAAMFVRKESIERQIADTKVELSGLLAATDSMARELRDLRLFFGANLNAQAVGQASAVGDTIRGCLANIEASVDRVTLELKDLSVSLASERKD